MIGPQILKEVAAGHNLQVHDLICSARFGHFVAARREAILKMREAGMGFAAIGRVMQRDSSTILHHCDPEIRKRNSDRKRARAGA